MLRILTGVDSRHKNDEFFRRIARAHGEAGLPVVVVVPEQFTLSMERALIDHLSLQGLMGIEVTSLSRLVHKIADQLVDSDRIPLNGLGRRLLIKKIVEDIRGELSVYQKSCERLGLIQEIERMLENFKNEKITCAVLEEFRDQLDPQDLLRRKLSDLLLIYERYNERVESAYVDEAQRIERFVTYMDYLPELIGAEVFFYGFIGFSKQEMEIIEAIERKSNQTSILLSLMGEGRDDLFAFTRKTLRQFENHFGQVALEEIKGPITQSIRFALETSNFGEVKLSHQVETFTARNIYTECEYVAGEIFRLVSQKSVDINEVHVMLLDPQSYRPILARALDQYGIPYFADEKSALMDTHIIQAVLSLLRFFETRFSSSVLFDYLKAVAPEEDLDSVDRLENYALAKGLDRQRWMQPLPDAEMEQLRKRWVSPLLDAYSRFEGRLSIEAFTDQLMELLEGLDTKERIDEMVALLKASGLEEQVLRLTQVWNKFVDIIQQIREAAGEREMTLEEHISYLEMAFEDEKIGVIPSIIDGVRIHVLERSVFLPNQVTFIMGVNERNLPMARGDSKVLSEREKERLLDHGIDLKDDSRLYRQKEMLDLFTVLSKTEGVCYLTYSVNDQTGKSLEASYYIKRVEDILDNLVQKDDLTGEDALVDQWLCHGPHLQRHLLRHLRDFRGGVNLSEQWAEIAAGFSARYPEDLSRMLDQIFYSNQASGVDGEFRPRELFTSITRLEKFAGCPFAYFAAYDLNLRERDRMEVSAIEIGNLYHELLELVIRDRMAGRPPAEIPALVEELLGTDRYSMFGRTSRAAHVAERIVELSGKIIANIESYFDSSSYVPAFAEAGFSKRDSAAALKPIVIELEGGRELVIEGKIDRIDRFDPGDGSETFCNVIDYKTGAKSLELGKILAGVDFQLPVYLMACQENPEAFKSEQVVVSGVFYYRIHDEFIDLGDSKVESKLEGKWAMKGLVLDDGEVIQAMDNHFKEEVGKSIFIPVTLKKNGAPDVHTMAVDSLGFERLMESTKRTMTETGQRMAEGSIDLAPTRIHSERACRFCEYANVCKFDSKMHDNRYRDLKVLSNREARDALMTAEGGVNDGQMV